MQLNEYMLYIWVNDGEKSKMIYPEELQVYLDRGFKKGRISWKNEQSVSN